MNIYDWDEIRAVVDRREFLTAVLAREPDPADPADIIELCAAGKFSGDLWAAQTFLGERHGLTPKAKAETEEDREEFARRASILSIIRADVEELLKKFTLEEVRAAQIACGRLAADVDEAIATAAAPATASVPVSKAETSAAKRANASPFNNWEWGEPIVVKGKETPMKAPRHVNDMLDDLHVRFWDFPRLVGTLMFDHDRKNRKIRTLDSPEKLFAWINEKSEHCVEWVGIPGAMTKKEFFESVVSNSTRYEVISGVPNWPAREDAFYTHGEMPAADPAGKWFNEFVAFFHPESEHDWQLLRAFVASPLYFKESVQRPLWVIDTNDGQGSGKSRLVELVAALYGSDAAGSGSPITIEQASLTNEMTAAQVFKRLLSEEGRKKRIVLIDNVTGFLKSATLSSLITQAHISGMRPYGHGEETRPNDLTYVLTANRCTLDRDLVDRSFVIKIKKPDTYPKGWERDVLAFIRDHRMNVISDIIHNLTAGAGYDVHPMSRFKTWECDVLAPILVTADTHSEVSKQNEIRRAATDGDAVRKETIEDHVSERLSGYGIDPQKQCIFLHSKVAIAWSREACPGIGSGSDTGVAKVLAELSAPHLGGLLTSSKEGDTRYKMKRGYWWNRDAMDLALCHSVMVMTCDVEGVIKLSEK